jgi:hypothetical protein
MACRYRYAACDTKRYARMTKPEQINTYHEQMGYWLWEPATSSMPHRLAIPRGMV